MERLIISLYEKIKKNNIKNKLSSLYWIYDIDNIIVKEGGLIKRYIKVLFFNRQFNENENLMRLYLSINGKSILQDSFQIVSEFKNKNVMGFVTQIDLAEEEKNVEITGYIVNGKKIELDKEYIDLNVEYNQEKLNAIYEYSGKLNIKELLTIPKIRDNYWLCSCGYINDLKTIKCPICMRKKEDLDFFINFDVEKEVLSKLQDRIEVNTLETAEAIKMKYALAVEKKYGIELKKVLLNIDSEIIEQQQEMMIDNKIEEYLKNNKLIWDVKEDFETNIQSYIQPLCKGIIKQEDVLKRMNLESEKKQYNIIVRLRAQKKKKRNKIIIAVSCVFLIGILSIVYYNMSKPPIVNRDYKNEKNVVKLLNDVYDIMIKEKNYEIESNFNIDFGSEISYSRKTINTITEQGNILKDTTKGKLFRTIYDGTSTYYYIYDKKEMKQYTLFDLRNASDNMRFNSSIQFNSGAYPDSKLYKMYESEINKSDLEQNLFLKSWMDYYTENIDLYSMNVEEKEEEYVIKITFDSNEFNWEKIIENAKKIKFDDKSLENIAGATGMIYAQMNHYPELDLRNIEYSATLTINKEGQIINLKEQYKAIDDGYGFHLSYEGKSKFTKYETCVFEKDILKQAVDQSENAIVGKEPELSDLK